MADIAGLAMRLVQRVEVRQDPTVASAAAVKVAAAGPCSSSSRKMNISPAAYECFDCGMRTGKKAASTAIAAMVAACGACVTGRAAKVHTAYANIRGGGNAPS